MLRLDVDRRQFGNVTGQLALNRLDRRRSDETAIARVGEGDRD